MVLKDISFLNRENGFFQKKLNKALRSAWEPFIWAVLLGVKLPNGSGLLDGQRICKKCWYDHQIRGQISMGDIHINFTCNPIIMYILVTIDEGNGMFIRGSGETSLQNLLALPFLQKGENPTPCRSNLNFDSVQEIRPGSPKSGDISTQRIRELETRERQFN